MLRDQAIPKIVPGDAGLAVVARLAPIHVDQVHAGQEAVLPSLSFPARVTPECHGRIERVPADVTRDERTGFEWYEASVGGPVEAEGETGFRSWAARAASEAAALLPGGSAQRQAEAAAEALAEPAAGNRAQAPEQALTPGMPVEVHARTGERSPLSYLVKPLTGFFVRSMGEE